MKDPPTSAGGSIIVNMQMIERDAIIPPPVPPPADFLCSGSDAIAMLGTGAGYEDVKALRTFMLDVGYVKTADELAHEIWRWCHICESRHHSCPRANHHVYVHPGLDGPPVIVPVRCKLSSCEHCGPIYVDRWRDHITQDLEFWLALPDRFHVYWFTQTFDPAVHNLPFGEAASHKKVTRLMADLIRSLRRRYGNCEYTAVIEPHKSGQIHVHAFLAFMGPPDSSAPVLRTRCTAQHRGGYNRHRPPAERLPQGACVCTLTGDREPCIQQIARDLGYGINNLQRLTSATAAAKYVTKRLGSYITKTVSAHNRPRYARALRQSRHFSVETHGNFLQRISDRFKSKHGLGELPPDGEWFRLYDFISIHSGSTASGLLSHQGLVKVGYTRYLLSIRPPPPENIQLTL